MILNENAPVRSIRTGGVRLQQVDDFVGQALLVKDTIKLELAAFYSRVHGAAFFTIATLILMVFSILRVGKCPLFGLRTKPVSSISDGPKP